MKSDAPLNTTVEIDCTVAPIIIDGAFLLQAQSIENGFGVTLWSELGQAVLSCTLNTAFMFPAEPRRGETPASGPSVGIKKGVGR